MFSKLTIVHNPIDLEYWSPGSSQRDPLSIVFLGSLTHSKGFHHIARAWPEVRARFPGAVLHVCGSGKLYDREAILGPLGVATPDYERCEIIPYIGSSREKASENGVTFYGLATPACIREVLRRSTIGIVNPNTSGSVETFCVSAVEMQACKLPVIGGRAGGLLETVAHKRSGYLVGNPQNLGRAIHRLLSDSDYTEKLSRSARGNAERFAADRILHEWKRLLGELLGGLDSATPRFRVLPFQVRRYAKEAIRLAHAQRLVRRFRN